MWNFTEEQFAWFGLTIGVTAFMLYMLFIIQSRQVRHLCHLHWPGFRHARICRQRHHPMADRQGMTNPGQSCG